MAVWTETRVVCDICKSKRRKVRAYRVSRAGEKQTAHVVLCNEHGAYVEDLLELGKTVGQPGHKNKGRIYTMDEILEMGNRRED